MPPDLRVPSGNEVSFVVSAVGVQIYIWTENPTNAAFSSWVFKAPDAVLFDPEGRVIGRHYAGPTWEDKGGGKVAGARLAGATVDSNAIPWLLLQAHPTAVPGIFAQTTFIQRVNTTGGLAPTAPPRQTSKEARIFYTADYYFYRDSELANPDNHSSAPTASGNGITVKVSRQTGVWSTVTGSRWEPRPIGTECPLYDVAYGNGGFVAVGNEGTVLVSRDGVSWIECNSHTDERLRGIVFANGGFVVVGHAGTVLASNDGLRWTISNSGTDVRLKDVLFERSLFVAVGWQGTILTSPDGKHWTARRSGNPERLDRIAYVDGRFVASVTNRTACVSSNGIEWSSAGL